MDYSATQIFFTAEKKTAYSIGIHGHMEKKKRNLADFASRKLHDTCYSSITVAAGAFFFTEAIPFSIPALDL